jgi:cytochrome b pre-mRNA-processing protein 3
MGLIARLFGTKRAEPEQRALWLRLVELARDPAWYAARGVADSMAGRFDTLSLILALVMLRMEGDPALRAPSARLTEHFIADMDGQLRQEGVGDLVVGKRIARLMSVLAGRIEACREGLAAEDPAVLEDAVRRNVTMLEGADPAPVAAALRALASSLAALSDQALLAGEIAP